MRADLRFARRAAALAGALLVLAGCGGGSTDSGVDCNAPGVICGKVGTGESSFNPTPTSARMTSLYLPVGLAFDAQGRLYIADLNNLRVRRVDADSVVRVFAGSGTLNGDPAGGVGLATQFALYHPSGLAFDGLGNLYVAVYHRYQVVRVAPDDSLRPVAGVGESGYDGDDGPALLAHLDQPRGVAVDSLGNVFIADTENHRIRRVDPNGIITTVAGSGAVGEGNGGYGGDGGPALQAQFNRPFSVAIAPGGGRLVIADQGNNRIRVIDLAAGQVWTLAGNGTGAFAGDGGPALQASLRHPEDARYSPDGMLYICDSGNHCVRCVALDGTITTVAGTGGLPGSSGDGGMATSARLDTPGAIAFDPQGNLWISDTDNNRIRRVVLH